MSKERFTLGLLALITLSGLALAFLWLSMNPTSENLKPETSTQPDKPYNSVLFSGDSISDGWYASVKSKGFVYRVQKEISPERSFHTHMHGYTVGQIAAKYTVPSDVALAVIELGTNDVNKGTPLATFKSTYSAYVKRVMNQSPDAKLICLGVFPSNDKAATFDDAIRTACEANAGKFIVMSDISKNPSGVGPEGRNTWAGPANLGHPNDYGHKIIADRIMRALDQSISDGLATGG